MEKDRVDLLSTSAVVPISKSVLESGYVFDLRKSVLALHFDKSLVKINVLYSISFI